MEESTYYNLGKRDMVAEILMTFKMDDDYEKTLLRLSNLLPDNPHAKYFINKLQSVVGVNQD